MLISMTSPLHFPNSGIRFVTAIGFTAFAICQADLGIRWDGYHDTGKRPANERIRFIQSA